MKQKLYFSHSNILAEKVFVFLEKQKNILKTVNIRLSKQICFPENIFIRMLNI